MKTKRFVHAAVLAGALGFAAPVFAQTTSDPSRASTSQTRVDVDNDEGFEHWGLLGLLGMAGLLGLKRREATTPVVRTPIGQMNTARD